MGRRSPTTGRSPLATQPPRFIYFDAGFTLLRPWPSVGYHYAAVAREFGADPDPAALDRAFYRAWPEAKRRAGREPGLPYGRNLQEARAFWAEVVRQCFRIADTPLPEDPAFQTALFDRFAGTACWRLYDDVEPALGDLDARGIPWGVLSNWDPRLRTVLEGFGLLRRLRALVISSEAGAEKPSRHVFRAAERACGSLPPSRIALVGDDPEEDFAGARAAGWQAVLLRRGEGKGKEAAKDLRVAIRQLCPEL